MLERINELGTVQNRKKKTVAYKLQASPRGQCPVRKVLAGRCLPGIYYDVGWQDFVQRTFSKRTLVTENVHRRYT